MAEGVNKCAQCKKPIKAGEVFCSPKCLMKMKGQSKSALQREVEVLMAQYRRGWKALER